MSKFEFDEKNTFCISCNEERYKKNGLIIQEATIGSTVVEDHQKSGQLCNYSLSNYDI